MSSSKQILGVFGHSELKSVAGLDVQSIKLILRFIFIPPILIWFIRYLSIFIGTN